ncbi:hypothetical protein DFH09DRAFT_1454065 [Mycena vulgaris]|nr:hypothetical protein DFH09DRAFT_1454065 [Mycena vulgaris]
MDRGTNPLELEYVRTSRLGDSRKQANDKFYDPINTRILTLPKTLLRDVGDFRSIGKKRLCGPTVSEAAMKREAATAGGPGAAGVVLLRGGVALMIYINSPRTEGHAVARSRGGDERRSSTRHRSRTSIPPCARTPAPGTLRGGCIVLSRAMRSILIRQLGGAQGPHPVSAQRSREDFAMGCASTRQRGNVFHTLRAPEPSHLSRFRRLCPPQSKDPAQRTRGLPRPRSVIFRTGRTPTAVAESTGGGTMPFTASRARRLLQQDSCPVTIPALGAAQAITSSTHRYGGCARAHPRPHQERRETQARGPRICCAASSLIAVGTTTMPRRNPLNARGDPSRSAGGLRCGRLGGADPPPRAEENSATPRAAAACRAWRSRSIDARDRGRSPGGATSAPPYSNDDPTHTDADGARRLPRHRLARPRPGGGDDRRHGARRSGGGIGGVPAGAALVVEHVRCARISPAVPVEQSTKVVENGWDAASSGAMPASRPVKADRAGVCQRGFAIRPGMGEARVLGYSLSIRQTTFIGWRSGEVLAGKSTILARGDGVARLRGTAKSEIHFESGNTLIRTSRVSGAQMPESKTKDLNRFLWPDDAEVQNDNSNEKPGFSEKPLPSEKSSKSLTGNPAESSGQRPATHYPCPPGESLIDCGNLDGTGPAHFDAHLVCATLNVKRALARADCR